MGLTPIVAMILLTTLRVPDVSGMGGAPVDGTPLPAQDAEQDESVPAPSLNIRPISTVEANLEFSVQVDVANVPPTFTGPIRVSILIDGDSAPEINGTTKVDVVDGVAEFTGLTMNAPDGQYTIVATADTDDQLEFPEAARLTFQLEGSGEALNETSSQADSVSVPESAEAPDRAPPRQAANSAARDSTVSNNAQASNRLLQIAVRVFIGLGLASMGGIGILAWRRKDRPGPKRRIVHTPASAAPALVSPRGPIPRECVTAQHSDTGGRAINQDACDVITVGQSTCWVVADGLGGHRGGEVASEIAVRAIGDAFRNNSVVSPGLLANHIGAAQAAILEKMNIDSSLTAMRSTVVVVLRQDDQIVWGHVGDSRFYHFRDGKVFFQTADHSVPQAMVHAGEITPDQMRYHEDRNRLLKSLGQKEDVRPDIQQTSVSLQVGDALLLCTDGFWEHVTETEMELLLAKSGTPEDWLRSAEELIRQRATGDYDNFTAVGVFVVG